MTLSRTEILPLILEAKKEELENSKKLLPLSKLKELVNCLAQQEENKFAASLHKNNSLETFSIIAEIKRKSPSKGALSPDLDPVKQADFYQKNGAAAISVLTEKNFFAGSPEDLQAVKKSVKTPVLRKDFLFEEYQLWESKLLGAEAVLLIGSCLEESQCKELIEISRDLGLEVLFEIHSFEDAEKAARLKPEIVGVNNRNLDNFKVDLDYSFKLIKEFKSALKESIWISESGLSQQSELKALSQAGFDAFLIGESLLQKESPSNFLRKLVFKNK